MMGIYKCDYLFPLDVDNILSNPNLSACGYKYEPQSYIWAGLTYLFLVSTSKP